VYESALHLLLLVHYLEFSVQLCSFGTFFSTVTWASGLFLAPHFLADVGSEARDAVSEELHRALQVCHFCALSRVSLIVFLLPLSLAVLTTDLVFIGNLS
jgi:hypothetical protein